MTTDNFSNYVNQLKQQGCLRPEFETALFSDFYPGERSAVYASDELHLRAFLTDLHQFDLVAVRIVRPALPVVIRALLGCIVLRSACFNNLFPYLIDIVDCNTDVEETYVVVTIRYLVCCTVEQFDELSVASIDIYDPRLARYL